MVMATETETATDRRERIVESERPTQADRRDRLDKKERSDRRDQAIASEIEIEVNRSRDDKCGRARETEPPASCLGDICAHLSISRARSVLDVADLS